MKEFAKDYVELCKDSGKFYKKHWKGLIVLNALIIGGELAWYKYKTKQFDALMNDVLEEEEKSAPYRGSFFFFVLSSRKLQPLL